MVKGVGVREHLVETVVGGVVLLSLVTEIVLLIIARHGNSGPADAVHAFFRNNYKASFAAIGGAIGGIALGVLRGHLKKEECPPEREPAPRESAGQSQGTTIWEARAQCHAAYHLDNWDEPANY